VAAKNVYNEYIQDKNHVHMNSTRWLTLTEFVKYLGKEGEEARTQPVRSPPAFCSLGSSSIEWFLWPSFGL
jgi:hypothetical protein